MLGFPAEMLQAPAAYPYAITPHDDDNEALPFRGIYVGGAGDIAVVGPDGDVVEFIAVPVGTILPVMGIRVNSTNTDATDLVGLR